MRLGLKRSSNQVFLSPPSPAYLSQFTSRQESSPPSKVGLHLPEGHVLPQCVLKRQTSHMESMRGPQEFRVGKAAGSEPLLQVQTAGAQAPERLQVTLLQEFRWLHFEKHLHREKEARYI